MRSRRDLERFLAGLTLPPARKEVVTAELLDHFECVRESGLECGLSNEEAESAALAALGDLESLRRPLQRVEASFELSRAGALRAGARLGVALLVASFAAVPTVEVAPYLFYLSGADATLLASIWPEVTFATHLAFAAIAIRIGWPFPPVLPRRMRLVRHAPAILVGVASGLALATPFLLQLVRILAYRSVTTWWVLFGYDDRFAMECIAIWAATTAMLLVAISSSALPEKRDA